MALVKLNNRGVRSATVFGSITGLGNMVFIKKLTASSSSTVSFVDGTSDVVLDDTYKEYLFTFKDIHLSSASGRFQFNGTTDGTNWNVTKTTTVFHSSHKEADDDAAVGYQAGDDLAQGTGFQDLQAYGNQQEDNDSCLAGYLHLFNPSSTTFAKHFMGKTNAMVATGYSSNCFVAGYCNTTSAVTGIRFQAVTGNVDAGDICLYGIN